MIDLAAYIDHTNLKPTASAREIQTLCEEAAEWKFHSVCVASSNVSLAARTLSGTSVRVCSVVGFPLGASLGEVKVYEAVKAYQAGASEIDMVLNVAWLLQGSYDLLEREVRSVVEAVPACIVKVILETSLLNDVQKVHGCEIIKNAGGQFVKTSTGFSSGGATTGDVRLLRKTVGPDFGVKASGGIRDRQTALAMIEAGANRLGTSASIAICS